MSDENNLTKVTSMEDNDLIRVVVGQASRNITKKNFASTIKGNLEDEGFITSDNLPASVASTRKIEVLNGGHTVTTDDDLLLMDASGGSLGVSLPVASSFYDSDNEKGQRVTVKKIDSSNTNTVTITSVVPELIDGQDSVVLESDGRPFVNIISDGTNWWLI